MPIIRYGLTQLWNSSEAAFIRKNNIKVLNVAGSGGSNEPIVVAFVERTPEDAFYPRVEAMLLRGYPAHFGRTPLSDAHNGCRDAGEDGGSICAC
jgi:hypothetical protein